MMSGQNQRAEAANSDQATIMLASNTLLGYLWKPETTQSSGPFQQQVLSISGEENQ
jgi:hypothetical protein